MIRQLASGQVVVGRYELVRPLAAGHDAATWLACDVTSGRELVLRFHEGEPGRLTEQVQHPALLAPIDRVRGTDSDCDVFEYLPGGEIGRLRGRAWTLIVRRLLPVADALAAIHDAGWAHGDVKSANVLLDANGLARLADSGGAVRFGTATTSAGGSPYSISPERLDGAPAGAGDDIYAFGVMLYELIGGHPPFYPQLTPERVRGETPAPLVGRPAPPAGVTELVARCLAKSPGERPASMRELAGSLQQCLSAESAQEAVSASTAAFTPRPLADAAPLRSAWQRTVAEPGSGRDARREGFRRGLMGGGALLAIAAAVFVFFVLPGLMRSRTAQEPAATAPTAATKPASTTAPAKDFAKLAEQKRRAEGLRKQLPERLDALAKRDAQAWGTTDLAQARADLAAGDAAMSRSEFEGAIQRFTATDAALDRLEQRAPEVVREQLAAAIAAFEGGRSREAQDAFAAVLRIDAANAVAKRGLERSRVLDDVLKETALGARAEQSGDLGGARSAWQRALALDPATPAAREGLARLDARASGDAYSAAMSRAMSALASGDYAAAQAAFEQAGRIRPGSADVADGLDQIRRAKETGALTDTLQRATAAEQSERWSEALAAYRSALQAESTLRPAQDGVERTEPRAMLDAQLQSYLDKPDRLYSNAGRDAARTVLSRAQSVPAPGPRLQQQVANLEQLIRQSETPIRVALNSDNATEVQIYRIGKLGLFDHRELELMPGRYTVVGTRQGFRDVRRELNLVPGAAPPTIVVRCEEPI